MKSHLLAASLLLCAPSFASAAQTGVLMGLVLSGGGGVQATPKAGKAQPPAILELTLSNMHEVFDNAAAAKLPVIVYYTRDWCAVCGKIEILYRYLAEQNQGKAVFARVDLDKDYPLRREAAPPYFYRYQDGRFKKLEPALVVDSAGDVVGFRLIPADKLPAARPAQNPPSDVHEI